MTRACDGMLPRAAALCLGMLAGGCGGGGGSGMKQPATPSAPWQVVLQNLDGALMSVSGTSARDVWAVGADTRDGNGALVLHFDGSGWTRKTTGVEADLWWVHVFSTSSIWTGGTHGTLLHSDGDSFQKIDTPRMGQIFGIWGAAEDDIWIVGGEPDAEPGFVWHYDGTSVSDMSKMVPDQAQGTPLFKVWGRASDDVWIVGLDGVAMHWDGSALTLGVTNTKERLFTVHGPPSGQPAFVAVGGDASAIMLQSDGTTWHTVKPDPAPTQLFGVCMHSSKLGYAVGYDGIVLEYDGAAWKLLTTPFELSIPLHSVWVDPDQGVWSVGGDVLSPVPVDGVLVHRGKAVPHDISQP